MADITYRGRIVQRWGTRRLVVELLSGPFASQKRDLHEIALSGRGTWGEVNEHLARLGFTATGWKRLSGAGELRSTLVKQ